MFNKKLIIISLSILIVTSFSFSFVQAEDDNLFDTIINFFADLLGIETIEIMEAEHLDENRDFISDIYDEVKALDNIWSETILSEHYVRLTFEINLTNNNDITLYPRVVNGTPRVEVYEINGNEIIAEFTNIQSNQFNKVFLTDLQGNQDTFDLRVVNGSIEIDYIIDPPTPPFWTVDLSGSPDPVDVGIPINYTGTGDDLDGGDYELVVCRNDSIEGNTPSAGGECDSGAELCKSPQIAVTTQASCNYTTQESDAGDLDAYGFLCDETGRCNETSIDTTTTVSSSASDNAPTITLNSPIDYYNSSSSIVFNCSAYDDINLINVSLYTNTTGSWLLNETNSSGLNNSIYLFTKTIDDGIYNWNCEACDNNSNCSFGSSNRTFTIDSTNPTSAITQPTNSTTTEDATPDINITLTDNLDSVIAYTFFLNNSANKTGTLSNNTPTNITMDTLDYSLWLIVVQAEDEVGNKYNSSALYLTIEDNVYPQFTNFEEEPTNNSLYLFGELYEFNITVSNTNGTVFLDFDGTNYSATNLTADEYNVTLGTLGADTYNYYWWAYGNGAQNNYNNSDSRAYVVQQTSPAGSLTNNESWTVTYPTAVSIAYSESNDGDGDLTYKVYRDGADKGNGEDITLGYGTYDYVLNTTGGTNYTTNSSMDAETLTVNQNNGVCDVGFNESSPIVYPATFLVWSNCTSSFTLYRNGSIIGNNTEQILGTGIYNFTAVRTDDTNYSNIYDEENFEISIGTGVIYAYIDNSRSNASVNLYEEKWLNATLETGSGNIELWYNDSLINVGTSPQTNLTNFTSEGIFNVSAVYDGNENYTGDIETWWVNVTVGGDGIDPTASFGTNPINYYNSSSATISFELSCSDNIDVDYLTLWGDWTGTWHENQTNSSPINDSTWSIDVSNIPEGQNYVWGIYCNDSSSNEDWNNNNRTFSVDLSNPTATINQPANNTEIGDGTPDINITLTDNFDSTIDYIFFLNGSSNQTGTASNNTSTNITMNNLPNGLWLIIVQAEDNVGRKTNSSTLYLTINSTGVAVSVNLIDPTNNSRTESSSQTFSCNATSSGSDLANITLRVWNSDGDSVYNDTVLLSGVTEATEDFIYSLPYSDTFEWDCIAYDTGGDSNSDVDNWLVRLFAEIAEYVFISLIFFLICLSTLIVYWSKKYKGEHIFLSLLGFFSPLLILIITVEIMRQTVLDYQSYIFPIFIILLVMTFLSFVYFTLYFFFSLTKEKKLKEGKEQGLEGF